MDDAAVSRLMEACGLKCSFQRSEGAGNTSRLMEACGLKYAGRPAPRLTAWVTPYGGVWIEIPKTALHFGHHPVTPYGGVWIEISPIPLNNP